MFSFKNIHQCEKDARSVMNWRNQPEILQASFHTKPKHWDQFLHEFFHDYFKNQIPPFFVYSGGEKIAFVRFRNYSDPRIKNAVDISISLHPQKRGLGLGPQIIKKGVDFAFNQGYSTVVAEIKISNRASINAFRKAGFAYLDSLDKKITHLNEIVPIHRLVVHKK